MVSDPGSVLIIPMAGRGSRLAEAGYQELKPFVTLNGHSILYWSLSWIVELMPLTPIVVIMRQDDVVRYRNNLARILSVLVGTRWQLVSIESGTAGQLETCMAAEGRVQSEAQVVIHNCDTWVDAGGSPIPSSTNFISLFPSESPSYSYASIGLDGRIAQIAEKVVLPGGHASTGTYGFRNWRTLKLSYEMAKSSMQAASSGELYVSCGIQHLLGLKSVDAGFDPHFVRQALPLGTADELAAAEAHLRNKPS